MIYLDSSVVLARIFVEHRSPPDVFWSQPLLSSRLLEYEVLSRVHVRAVDRERLSEARSLIDRVSLTDLTPRALERALKPFPLTVRTLDALHLATMDFLRAGGAKVELASYDRRLSAAAQALGFALADA